MVDRSKAADSIRAIGFDATCSLVVLGSEMQPIGISPHAPEAAHRNIIRMKYPSNLASSKRGIFFDSVLVWRDHRAVKEAQEQTIAATNTAPHLIKNIGGVISPEMELPKVSKSKTPP